MAKEIERSETGQPINILPFVLKMGAYVLLGVPLVAVIWAGVNDILALQFATTQVLMAFPAALLLWGLLILVNRSTTRWLGEPAVTDTDAKTHA